MSTRRMGRSSVLTGVVAVLAICFAVASDAAAQTITVTTRDDATDFPAPQQAQNLPGPDGRVSFREACLAANNTPGPQTIAFAIPAGSPGWSNGVILLWMGSGAFVLNDDETTIDGSTQTAFTGDTNPNGWEVGIQASVTLAGIPALIVNADRCVVRGLDRIVWAGYGVKLSGNDNRVVGCTLYNALYASVSVEGVFGGATATGNIIGGTQPGEGNVLGGVSVLGNSDSTTVVGNVIRGGGLRIEGATQYNHICSNVRVGGPTLLERNVIFGGGGFGEEGFPTGQKVSIWDVQGALVEGNYIGTNVDGSVAESPRAPTGVLIRNSSDVIIRDNLISGIAVTGVNHYAGQRFGIAIDVNGTSSNIQILGNRIGTDAAGTGAIPNLYGVVVQPFAAPQIPAGVTIGGALTGQANLIAYNESAGVRISGSVANVSIQGNSIHSNGALGIDLLAASGGGAGVSPNDAGDSDAGGNGLQNFPVLTAAYTDATSSVTIEGSLNSSPSSAYLIQFFSNDACDPSGFGEGQTFLGELAVNTNVGGSAPFGVSFAGFVPVGAFVTATATSASDNTSEFSACTQAQAMPQIPGDIDGDVDAADCDLFVGVLIGTDTNPDHVASSDLNGNGEPNGLDVRMFVAAVMGG